MTTKPHLSRAGHMLALERQLSCRLFTDARHLPRIVEQE
jgi:hypothetical protein